MRLQQDAYVLREYWEFLDSWPVTAGRNYMEWVNQPQPKEEVEVIRYAIKRGRPYGSEEWIHKTAKDLNLESTLNPRGRPLGN